MQPVKCPREDGNYDERFSDCKEALEGKVQQILEEAVRSGWSREEATKALLDVATDTHQA